ncbi:MAG: methyltransferase [Lagierella massiliensis]|nr:methyltransferase [Lagierella massiliensis]
MLIKNYIPGTNLHIYSDKKKFSFGVDAILVSSFANFKQSDEILEIGSGTGIIALRVQGIYNTKKIYAVEIQEDNYTILLKNIATNKLEDKIIPIYNDINKCYEIIKDNSLDGIISNPPYFKYGCGIDNKNENHLISRYEKYMTIENIFEFSKEKLKQKGKLYLINRPERLVDMLYLGRKFNIEPKRMIPVISREGEKPQFILMEFIKEAGEFFTYEKPLVIYGDDGYRKEIIDIYDGKKVICNSNTNR